MKTRILFNQALIMAEADVLLRDVRDEIVALFERLQAGSDVRT